MRHAGVAMKISRQFQLVFVIALALAANVEAKCPTASATVSGSVENVPSGLTGLEATVVLETSTGKVSKTTALSNGGFSVDMPFSTRSSSSLFGDRCHTVPTLVQISIVASGKVYLQEKLNFKDSFEMTKLYEYRLKQKLSLQFPKVSVKQLP
jgi:hypothetical protein